MLLNGVDWFSRWAPRSRRVHAVLAVRARHPPGQYEAPLGITLRELLDYAGGVRAGTS
jgi:NADH-quinone oxidoreductase subunit F